jgi:hypothetical protein
MIHMRSLLVQVAATISAVAIPLPVAEAQAIYKKVGTDWVATPQAYFSATGVECSNEGEYFPDKSFVKQGLEVLIDARVEATGHCDVYVGQTYFWSEYREFGQIYWSHTPNGKTKKNLYYSATNPGPEEDWQVYDTRIPGSGNPGTTQFASELGPWLFTFYADMYATHCKYTGVTDVISPKLYVTPCRPTWYLDGIKQTRAPASGDITIAVPSGFETAKGPADAAASAWSAAMGRTVQAQSNTTCTTKDPNCIQLTDTFPVNSSDCAQFFPTAGTDASGYWVQSSEIQMKNTYKGADSTRIEEIIGHELGHYFGLYNMDDASCTDSNTVMNAAAPGGCYSGTAPNPTPQTGPTPADKEALRVPYGDGVPITCGW